MADWRGWQAPSALNIGSIQLPIVLKLDSTLSGVLQGALVLLVLLVEGARQRYMKRMRMKALVPPPEEPGPEESLVTGEMLPTMLEKA